MTLNRHLLIAVLAALAAGCATPPGPGIQRVSERASPALPATAGSAAAGPSAGLPEAERAAWIRARADAESASAYRPAESQLVPRVEYVRESAPARWWWLPLSLSVGYHGYYGYYGGHHGHRGWSIGAGWYWPYRHYRSH